MGRRKGKRGKKGNIEFCRAREQTTGGMKRCKRGKGRGELRNEVSKVREREKERE